MTYVASPDTRAYARAKGIDLETVAAATGRGALAREDVDRYLDGGPAGTGASISAGGHAARWQTDHAAYGPITQEPVSRIAKLAADNLGAANAVIPQVTHQDRADMRAVESFRSSLRQEAVDRGVKLTALAFHVCVFARCLAEFPRFNASLSDTGETLTLKHYIHIGIAVDTPHGLMVPVIRDADCKGLWQIAEIITELAERAQARKLRPEDMDGASATISNLGGIGGTGFTPIVNPPEVAILGLTRAEQVPQWDGEGWKPVLMTPLSLSYDHRVINGADAARFLARYAELMAEPRRLLI